MDSRERMLTAIAGEKPDYIPCSFMLFFNLQNQCATDTEFVERQLDLGLDAFVHAGYLDTSFHPDVQYSEWTETKDGEVFFCRRIDTPKGPLTGRVKQVGGWPNEGDFPLMKDWIVSRAEEVLVKPEQDLEKLPYVLGEFTDEQIGKLKETAREAQRLKDKYGLLMEGGWKGTVKPGDQRDPGVMGADAMAWLSGYEDVMILSLERPELIEEYSRIIHQWNMRQIEIYLDVASPDLIVRRGWYETTEFWTPEAYRRIIYPTIKREVDLVHEAGKKYGYIITSAFLPIIDDILASGIDVLIGFDPAQGKGTEMHEVKRRFREKGRCLWGGVSGAITVELGTEDETEAAVKDALFTLGEGGGFILSPVDNVRENTQNAWRNTYRFIEAWKRYRTVW